MFERLKGAIRVFRRLDEAEQSIGNLFASVGSTTARLGEFEACPDCGVLLQKGHPSIAVFSQKAKDGTIVRDVQFCKWCVQRRPELLKLIKESRKPKRSEVA